MELSPDAVFSFTITCEKTAFMKVRDPAIKFKEQIAGLSKNLKVLQKVVFKMLHVWLRKNH